METLETAKRPICNTRLKSTKSTSKSENRPNQLKYWCFTYNNYDEADIPKLVETFKSICTRYIFEKEICPTTGTPHLQGYIELKKEGRWSEFGLSDKIRWSKREKPAEASITYCQKDFQAGLTKDIYTNIPIRKPLKLINPERQYQKEILDIIKTDPEERKVHWYYDTKGNVGKSQFAKYLVVKYNAVFVGKGKNSDLLYTVLTEYENGNPLELVIMDIPRSQKNKINYDTIESIKTGLIYSPKYEGGKAVFNSPHIIIFSNFLPKMDDLSEDRWEIFKIKEDHTTEKYTVIDEIFQSKAKNSAGAKIRLS